MMNRIFPQNSSDGDIKKIIRKHLRIRMVSRFKDPKDLDRYVASGKEQDRYAKWIASELELIEDNLIAGPREEQVLWKALMHLVAKMTDNKKYCYHIFEDRVANLARKILQ